MPDFIIHLRSKMHYHFEMIIKNRYVVTPANLNHKRAPFHTKKISYLYNVFTAKHNESLNLDSD